jgi:hypothetical protein
VRRRLVVAPELDFLRSFDNSFKIFPPKRHPEDFSSSGGGSKLSNGSSARLPGLAPGGGRSGATGNPCSAVALISDLAPLSAPGIVVSIPLQPHVATHPRNHYTPPSTTQLKRPTNPTPNSPPAPSLHQSASLTTPLSSTQLTMQHSQKHTILRSLASHSKTFPQLPFPPPWQ